MSCTLFPLAPFESLFSDVGRLFCGERWSRSFFSRETKRVEASRRLLYFWLLCDSLEPGSVPLLLVTRGERDPDRHRPVPFGGGWVGEWVGCCDCCSRRYFCCCSSVGKGTYLPQMNLTLSRRGSNQLCMWLTRSGNTKNNLSTECMYLSSWIISQH